MRELVVPSYELGFTDCPFQAVVDGEYETALAEIEAHQEETEAGPLDHFVNVHRRR